MGDCDRACKSTRRRRILSVTSFGLTVQLLPINQQVLTLAQLVGVRNGDGWFDVDDISRMFDALRVPPPKSIPRGLGTLRSQNLTTQVNREKPWSVTPLGAQKVSQIIGEFDYDRIELELQGAPGADFAHARYSVISPLLAPHRWQQGISRLLERYPFEANVFCMTRFPKEDKPDPLLGVIPVLREAVAAHRLTLHLASDRQAEDDLLGNVGAYMWACQYGIGLFENRLGADGGLNDNMLIELGSMLTMGRRCAIIKDRDAPTPPTDLSGQIYKSVNFEDLEEVSEVVHRWIAEDLALGKCSDCV